MSKYKPAIFQPTIRPDWGGVLSYLSVEEKSKILECILKYPLVDCDSPFWIDVIKPELDSQFDSFKEVCKAKAKGGKSRWEKDKDNTSITNAEDKDSISSPHGNQEDSISSPYGNLLKEKDKDKDKEEEKEKEKEKEKFQLFVQEYPQKVNTSDFSFFCEALKKVSFDKLLEQVKNYSGYVEFKGTDEKYIKSAKNWLKEECWNNDYDYDYISVEWH